MSWPIYLIHFVANLRGPYPENLFNSLRFQSTWAVPWKPTWPIPFAVYKSHTVKIVMTHAVANLREPYRESLHGPFSGQSKWSTPWKYTCPSPWPIYMSRTVKIYMTRSVYNLHGPYCENLHGPFRVQSTWAVLWKSTRLIPCSVDRSRIVRICMSIAIANLHDPYFHQCIFDTFTMEDKNAPSCFAKSVWRILENVILSSEHLPSTFQFIFRYEVNTEIFEVARLKLHDSERESTVILQNFASCSPISKAIYPRRLEPVTITSSLHEDLNYSLGAYRV